MTGFDFVALQTFDIKFFAKTKEYMISREMVTINTMGDIFSCIVSCIVFCIVLPSPSAQLTSVSALWFNL